MKTTRFVPGNKVLVQLADKGVYGALVTLRARVNLTRKTVRGGNGKLRSTGWSVWLWQDAKNVLIEQGF